VNLPFMRRIHPEPDALAMKNLSLLVKALGLSLPRSPGRADVQQLLERVKGEDCSLAVNLVVLRSFEKAQYAPLSIGHYALASTHYCHFTSPIRRYADLLVHRVLQCHLEKRPDLIDQELDLTAAGKHISFTEQRAEDAERELNTVLLLQMLSNRIGDELDCVVTGLTGFGLFVQSKKFGIEGLIRMEDLGPDVWKYSVRTHCITGSRTGHNIHLGQSMKVRIVSVNVPGRQLNVAPSEPLVKAPAKAVRKKTAGKPRKGRTRKRSGRTRR